MSTKWQMGTDSARVCQVKQSLAELSLLDRLMVLSYQRSEEGRYHLYRSGILLSYTRDEADILADVDKQVGIIVDKIMMQVIPNYNVRLSGIMEGVLETADAPLCYTHFDSIQGRAGVTFLGRTSDECHVCLKERLLEAALREVLTPGDLDDDIY